MAKRYYFTNENGDNIGNDHIGNIRGAKTAAKRLANELNCEVCINDCETEDMLDFVYPDKTETSVESVEETTVSVLETVETEIAEKYILRLTDEDGFVFCIKVFVGTSKEADEESERVMAETGYDVSYVRYTDSRWNSMEKKYYCGTDSKSALSVVVRKTETAEQETELNAEVAQVEAEQTAENKNKTETTDENITVSGTNQGNINVLIVADIANTFEMITHTGYFDTS